MGMSEVKIEIPQVMIEDMVRAEMVKALGNKDLLIEKVVQVAMNQKKDSYSQTGTYFQETVNAMIRDEATKIFAAWIEGNRTNIEKALLSYLNANKQKRLMEFAANLAGNISSYGISVNLDLRERT
jgi:hypothetical protein